MANAGTYGKPLIDVECVNAGFNLEFGREVGGSSGVPQNMELIETDKDIPYYQQYFGPGNSLTNHLWQRY